MSFRFFLRLTAVVLAAAAAAAEHIRRKVGEDVTFSLGAREIKNNDGLLWSYGPNETVLFYVNIGKDEATNQRGRFKLNLTTGALVIKGLLANDTSVYHGQIFNGNGTSQYFNLTVEEADPIQPSAGPEQPAAASTIIIIIIIIIVLAAVLLLSLLIVIIVKKKKGRGTNEVV